MQNCSDRAYKATRAIQAERRNQIARLRAIPLELVLELVGAQRDRHDKRKWHTTEGVLSVTGTKFINWNCHHGGGGAIDLAMHLNHSDFKGALAWLGKLFAAGNSFPELIVERQPTVLKLPMPDSSQLPRVQSYLRNRRSIPDHILESLVSAGTLYADRRGNAVFMLRKTDGTPVGAELRGTNWESWRGMAPGTHKNLGFFSFPALHREPLERSQLSIVLCESAIDAVSCHVIRAGGCCISTAGARPSPAWLEFLICKGHQIYCGFDADATGDEMAQMMISRYSCIKRLRPGQHDWNDVLRLRGLAEPIARRTQDKE